jgi:hypothetical protein
MPVIKNVSPLGALDIPLLRRVVEFGEEVEVKAEHAAVLLEQDIYEAVDKAAKTIVAKIKAARAAVESDAPVEARPATTKDAPRVPDKSKDVA